MAKKKKPEDQYYFSHKIITLNTGSTLIGLMPCSKKDDQVVPYDTEQHTIVQPLEIVHSITEDEDSTVESIELEPWKNRLTDDHLFFVKSDILVCINNASREAIELYTQTIEKLNFVKRDSYLASIVYNDITLSPERMQEFLKKKNSGDSSESVSGNS